jgi:TetR/AcrR family transcriptional regulator
MSRPLRVSPDRILAAAAVEFAERGFAGARVDRIARRARVNKAMLYYYFRSKQELYRTLLRRMFTLAAERLQAIAAGAGTPADKVDRMIAAAAALVREHASFPAIMLREVAERGAHLDRETLRALSAVPRAFGAIVQEGVAQGVFRPVNPLFAYFTMLPPIIFHHASAPIRDEMSALHLMNGRAAADEFVEHMQAVMRRALSRDADERSRPTS